MSNTTGWGNAPASQISVSDAERAAEEAKRLALIASWSQAANNAKAAIEYERKLRNEVMHACFANDKREGTEHFELPEGWDLKAVKKLSYNLATDKVNEALDKIEALGERGKLLAERLVKFKPELSISEFKKLDEGGSEEKEIKGIIEGVLTIKDASPSLELIAPKLKS